MKQKLLKSFTLRVCMLVAMLCGVTGASWGEDQIWTHNFASPEAISNNSITVDGVTWNVSTTIKKGSPTIDKGNSYSYYCLKFGSGANNCFSSVTFSTDYFTNYSVKSVTIVVLHNAKKTGTLVASQGNTTIGTLTNEHGTTWTTYTVSSEEPGSGGPLSFTYSPTDCAVNIRSISVTYTTSSTPLPTLSVNPASITFGEKTLNSSNSETFTVTYANLTQDLNVSVGSGLTGVSVSPTTISKDGNGTQEVTVTYAPSIVGYISGNITVSNTDDEVSKVVAITGSSYDPNNIPSYNLFTGNIEEGDYIIYYNGYAMKNTIESNRFGYALVSPSGNVITTTDASIVWHIAPNGEYWTIFSPNANKYAAGTTSKNQGALITNVTDLAKWTVTLSNEGYRFENLGRSNASTDNGNKWLRNNGASGFACYSTSTGGALSLYKLDDGTPSISSDNVNIAFDATVGQIEYSIANPVSGGVLTAVSSENWLTVGTINGNAVPLTCTANSENTARTATVTLTYTYGNNETVTKEITVTQAAAPLIYTTIPELFAAATTTSTHVNVTFGNWVVTGVNYNQVFVSDGTNGLIIYQTGHGFTVGNTLSGTASCNLVLFNGAAEITGLTSSSTGLTVGTNGNITPVPTTIDALAAVNTGSVVTLNNLSYDGSVLSDGTNSVSPQTTLYDGTFENGKRYHVTGVFVMNNAEKRILPRSASDIVEAPIPTHTARFFINGEEQTEAEVSEGAAITFPTATATIQGKKFMGWTTASIEGVTNEAPAFVASPTMGTNDVIFYAVYATQETEDHSGTATLTAEQQEETTYADHSFTDNQNNTWTAFCATQNQSNVFYYNLRNNNGEDSYLLSPEFEGNITSIKIVGWNGSSTQDRTLSIMSTDGEDTYGTITVAMNSKPSSELTATLTDAEFTQFKLKASDPTGIQYVTVNYGTPATYSGYCTTIPAPYTRTVSEGAWGTICLNRDATVEGATVYSMSGVTLGSDGKPTSVALEEATQMEGGKAYLFKATSSQLVARYVAGSTAVASPIVNGGLVGVYERTNVPLNCYVMQNNEFHKCVYKDGVTSGPTDVTVAANRAYLDLAQATIVTNPGQVKVYIPFHDVATAVQEMKSVETKAEIFDLAGRRVQKATKGIYIVNGKKVAVK